MVHALLQELYRIQSRSATLAIMACAAVVCDLVLRSSYREPWLNSRVIRQKGHSQMSFGRAQSNEELPGHRAVQTCPLTCVEGLSQGACAPQGHPAPGGAEPQNTAEAGGDTHTAPCVAAHGKIHRAITHSDLHSAEGDSVCPSPPFLDPRQGSMPQRNTHRSMPCMQQLKCIPVATEQVICA